MGGYAPRIAAGGALLALGLLYAPTLAAMAHEWQTHPYAGHGLFVPLISAVVAWGDRDRLRARAGPGSWWGAGAVVAALGFLAVARQRESLFLAGLSIVPAVAGLVWWAFGWRCLRAAVFPVAFLAFMPPLPRTIVDAVTLDLQLFAAWFAGQALELAGVPFLQDGLLIRLPNLTLEVAEACNGLRFLTALVVLSIAFAQVSQATLGRKILLAAAAVPAAIVANAVRVAGISVAAYHWGPEAASGLTHHLIGKSVWALTLVPLILLAWWLRRGVPSAPTGATGPLASGRAVS